MEYRRFRKTVEKKKLSCRVAYPATKNTKPVAGISIQKHICHANLTGSPTEMKENKIKIISTH